MNEFFYCILLLILVQFIPVPNCVKDLIEKKNLYGQQENISL